MNYLQTPKEELSDEQLTKLLRATVGVVKEEEEDTWQAKCEIKEEHQDIYTETCGVDVKVEAKKEDRPTAGQLLQTSGNPSNVLDQFLNRFCGHGNVRRESVEAKFVEKDGWITCDLVLHILGGEVFRGAPCLTEKDAKHAAAQEALDHYYDLIAAMPPSLSKIKKKTRPPKRVREKSGISSLEVAKRARETYEQLWKTGLNEPNWWHDKAK
eukprot:TRINITY_DN82453_c0_g1_i1.p1 TRINITY_DN82453_c0_g1~~TRINITY_DN82453_c0_g1_i1.p1  ORF type:complete len:212 (-),score=48.10 TRINITY_DN82453_c0_g1_i1:100-735(-)